jgi:hypothetical protein
MPPTLTRNSIHISATQYSCVPYNSKNRTVFPPQKGVKRLVSGPVCEVGTGFLCIIYVNARHQKANDCETSTEGLVYGTKCWGTHEAGLLNDRLMRVCACARARVCVCVRLTNFTLPCFSDLITVMLSMCMHMTRSKFGCYSHCMCKFEVHIRMNFKSHTASR